MNGSLFKLTIRSIVRRKKEIVRVLAATLIAMFFLAGVLIFQSSMSYWQMANNKQWFGDWFVMEFSQETPNKELLQHPYLEKPAWAGTAAYIYDNTWEATDYRIGYMTDEFMRQGNITIDKGRLPQVDNEIALDYNMLISLGYEMELDTTITLNIYTDKYGNKEKGITKDFILCGILNNYTNAWIKGDQCPTVIVTKNAYEEYHNTISNVYIYKLKDFVQAADYSEIYDGIKSLGTRHIFYNSNVYDYQVWGSDVVYNYIYFLIMVIGVAAITYQLIGYRGSRYEHYIYMRQLGATKGQMRMIELLENFILLTVPAAVGIVLAALVGKIICFYIEIQKGVSFYHIDFIVLVKCVIALLAAAVIQEIIGIFYIKSIEKGKKVSAKGIVQGRQKKANVKLKITGRNINRIVRKRFIHANGFILNVGIRIFSLAMTVVIVLCIWNTYTAYEAYQNNNDFPDFVAYATNKNIDEQNYIFNTMTMLNRLSPDEQREHEAMYKNDPYGRKKSYMEKTPSLEEFMKRQDNTHIQEWVIHNSAFCKDADAALIDGIPESILNDLQMIGGIEDIDYSYFEANRVWSWEGMDYDELGMKKFMNYDRGEYPGESLSKYQDKYIFATEYVKPTKELYDRIRPYLDETMIDYEAFERGEQIVVFLDSKADGFYDDTIKVGTTINYMATPLYFESYEDECKDSSKFKKVLHGISDAIVHFENNAMRYYLFDKNIKVGQNNFGSDIIEQYKEWNIDEQKYRWCFEGRVSPSAAGVVILNDQIREELSDIIPKFGYYTALASENMAQNIMDSQTKLLGQMLQKEITQEETPYKLAHNQITVRFNLSSAYSGTNNILSAYCNQSGFGYTSFAERKDQYRNKVIDALLQYGITLLAAMFIDVVILVIVAKNKLEKRKERYHLLMQIGADNDRIRKMWMMEAFRESLWCIFTLPFVLIAQWWISRGEKL